MMDRREEWLRIAVWVALILSWAVAVWYMWDAVAALPSAEGPDRSPVTPSPTPRTFFAAAAFSAFELALVLAIAWPWRSELYGSRILLAMLALTTWLAITAPLDLNRLDWVHRRWLIFTILILGLSLPVLMTVRRIGRRRTGDPSIRGTAP